MAPSFGQQLRSRREQRGLSLADAAHLTRIPQRRLEYLETDNFAAFGNLTYARSFLRIYSRFLGLDASPLLNLLPHGRLGSIKDSPHLTAVPEQWMATTEHSRSRIHKKAPTQLTSPAFASLAMFLMLFGGTVFWTLQLGAERQFHSKEISLMEPGTGIHTGAPHSPGIHSPGPDSNSGNQWLSGTYVETQPTFSTVHPTGRRNVIKLLQPRTGTIEGLSPERSGKVHPDGID